MARRRTTQRVVCAHEGCNESAWYEYDTQREAREAAQRRAKTPYLCSRHSAPDKVLGPDNRERVHVLVATKVPSRNGEFLPGLFWRDEGSERSGSGFVYGPGFKAFAKDFPEGTRLVVTARIAPAESGGGLNG